MFGVKIRLSGVWSQLTGDDLLQAMDYMVLPARRSFAIQEEGFTRYLFHHQVACVVKKRVKKGIPSIFD